MLGPCAEDVVLSVAGAVALDLCTGVSIMHEHGFIHGDIKIHNIVMHSAPDGPCAQVCAHVCRLHWGC
jgi:serine/threonine protein kinase